MDKRISYKIVIDTETAPLDKNLTEVLPNNMLVYDIGWAVVDKRGKVYEKHSFVVYEVYALESDIMNSAYYADKIPRYEKDLHDKVRVMKRLENIRYLLYKDIETYGVTEIYAHNMRFDYGTLNNTLRYVTKSKYRYFFPYGVKVCDTLKMARDVILPMPTYIKFCNDNGYLQKNGRPRATAEILYRFISRDMDFIESHTGLEDVMIEKEILAYCYSKHKKMRKLLFE